MQAASDDTRTSRPRLGVGLLGGGPVVQAIHLPTLARLGDLFTVQNVMDVSADVAQSVAGRVGANWCTSMDELLADDAVDVVAICSPQQFHATQAIAAMRAGKKAVLCEKPFAESREQAAAIAAVSAETGVPVIVGAMHTFDPGWLAATDAWGDLPRTAHTVRSRIVIPPNERFEDWATEVFARPEPRTPPEPSAAVFAGILRGAIMGLAIHDLPLVRRFISPESEIEVDYSDSFLPFGYVVGMKVGSRMVHLSGHVSAQWEPSWTFEAFDDITHLKIDFTPSYVHAGSATATVSREGVSTVFGPFTHNGYEGEWRVLYDAAHGVNAHLPRLDDLVDDVAFAVEIADRAIELTLADAS